MRGSWSNKSGWAQLSLLLLWIIIGTVLFSALWYVMLLLYHGSTAVTEVSTDMLRLMQLLSALGTFLLPAWMLAYFCSEESRQYLSIGALPTLKQTLLTALCMLLFLPVISFAEHLNSLLVLPEFLAPVEEWMKEQERVAEELSLRFLADTDWLHILFNLLVIAVCAAICEEFFFRGALQRIIGKWSSNPHTIIWVVAIVFSAIHLQFYGFLPRMMMGALFGYFLLWGRNIWIPVIAHFTNNALVVLAMSDSSLKENKYVNGDITDVPLYLTAIVAVIGLCLFIPAVRKLRRELQA
ncbi:CPBP family intramembrane metalloprotease [Parabacteroides sp. OttesenSCG-928-N08]|nr:CPBP family intramembrane metalloprotease [Parabacteroides sp. OttesenSCG-928-N08]